MDNQFFSTMLLISFYVISYIILFTIRGCFQALIVYWCGDSSPRDEGFISLNPAVHINPVGMLIFLLALTVTELLVPEALAHTYYMAMVMLLSVQWTYPVPFNTTFFRRPVLGTVLVALSNALSMVLCTLGGLYLIRYFPTRLVSGGIYEIAEFLSILTSMAAWFSTVFLLPLPGFPVFELVREWAPYSMNDFLAWLEEHRTIIFIVLFVLPGTGSLFLRAMSKLSSYIIAALQIFVF